MSKNIEDNGLFADLANPIRLEILKILQTTPSTQSKLSDKLDMTIQGLQRHIGLLLKSGLIRKDVDGNLLLSSVGIAALEQIPTFLFLSKYQKYFQDHDFLGIPKKLVQRLGDLYECEFIDDTMATWQRAKEVTENCEKYFVAVSSMQPIEFFDIAKIKLEKGVKFKIGFPENRFVVKGHSQKANESGWTDAIENGRAEEFFVKNVPVTVVITEKDAEVLFANTKTGQMDGSAMFYSKNKDFRRWCLDLFDYYYHEVERIATPPMQEV
jgi:predicted transcriptional regulator